jgi:hypothetical protein
VLAVWALVFVVPGLNGFSAELEKKIESRHHPSELEKYEDVLQFLRSRPDNSVVLSDPKTSYLISATTSHRVVAVNGPHGNPGDPLAMERMAGIRDVLSPYVLHSRTVAVCERFGVDFVVVNGRMTKSPTEFLMEWDPALFALTAAKLDQLDTRFRPVFESADIRVYVYYPGPVPPDRWYPEGPPVSFEAGHVHDCLVKFPRLGVNIVKVFISPRVVLPGEMVDVTVGYYKADIIDYGLPYKMYIRFDHESVFNSTRRYPGEKQVRRWRERRGGYRLRFRADVRPFAGVLSPDQWPIGVTFYENFRVRMPSNLKPGGYRVEFKMERDTMIPNFALSDILFNRDHYSGDPCMDIEVTRQAVREK